MAIASRREVSAGLPQRRPPGHDESEEPHPHDVLRLAPVGDLWGALLLSPALRIGRSERRINSGSLGDLVGPEQQSKAFENLAHLARSQDSDPLLQSRPIDRPDLGDVDDTCPRKSCLTSSETDIPRHGAQPEVRGHCRHNRCGDGAPIEAVVLDDDGRPPPARRRALRWSEMKPVDFALPDHQRSSAQSLPRRSSSDASRLCPSATSGVAKRSFNRRVISASRRARTACSRTRVTKRFRDSCRERATRSTAASRSAGTAIAVLRSGMGIPSGSKDEHTTIRM